MGRIAVNQRGVAQQPAHLERTTLDPLVDVPSLPAVVESVQPGVAGRAGRSHEVKLDVGIVEETVPEVLRKATRPRARIRKHGCRKHDCGCCMQCRSYATGSAPGCVTTVSSAQPAENVTRPQRRRRPGTLATDGLGESAGRHRR